MPSRSVCAAGGLVDSRGQVRAVEQHEVAAERLEFAHQALAAHDIQRTQAALPGQLDQVTADARVRGVLDHPLARLERHEVLEQEACGRRVDRQQRELRRIALRGRHAVGRAREQPLGKSAGTDRREHPIADPQARHLGTDRGDAADTLVAGRARQWPAKALGALHGAHVGDVDRRGLQPHQHLVGRRRGHCEGLEPQDLRRLAIAALHPGTQARAAHRPTPAMMPPAVSRASVSRCASTK